MKTISKSPLGLIATFEAVTRVQTPTRRMLAVEAAGVTKLVTPHTLRHAFCTHALRAGNDAATVQGLMGHDDLATTMIYAHGDHARGVSPMDAMDLVPVLV